MIGWFDCSSGVAGDMLLAALVDAGVDLSTMQAAVDAVSPEPVHLRAETVRRGGLRATRIHVDAPASMSRRTWADIRDLLANAALHPTVQELAAAAFTRLAEAEARVHGTDPDHVHFHEVGALDAIADVVGFAAGFQSLGLDQVWASAVAVGSGTVRTQHGLLPVPAPAVVELFRDVPTHGGGAGVELATPTGAALLTTVATAFGDQPPMRTRRQAFGAGGRDVPGRPNVVRLLLGEAADRAGAGTPAASAVVLEANVDDLDPRLWPAVLSKLMAAGASDAWLVPILMKKGRPGHTLCVLADAQVADGLRAIMFTETTTIGVRETPVRKRALGRTEHSVSVDGQQIRVKTATLDGVIVNAQPEYDDVAAAAAETGRPVKQVLAAATAAIRQAGLAP
ncbi:MAG TPA: nickel pincer cofactor biosynthesis protein LarC [Jiangellales bacterium]|nr:nickel pincer cofactor biosynthesis protein LarC [Jiangellales bacterium]